MDGGAGKLRWAGVLVASLIGGALARAAAPTSNSLLDDLLPDAAHATVVADQGGITIESVEAPAAEAMPTEPSTLAPNPSKPQQTNSQPAPGNASEAGAAGGNEPLGVGDAGKRGTGEGAGEGVDDGAEVGHEAAPATGAEPARERLPLGGLRTGERKGFGDTAKATPMGGFGILRTLGAVAAVIVLIVLSRLLLGRVARVGNTGIRAQLGAGGRAPSGIVQILGRYPVARGHTLVLMKLDRRILLLSQTAAGFTTLTEITDAEEVASILSKSRDEEGESLTARFGTLLRRLERDPAMADTDDIEIAPYLRRPSLDEIDGFEPTLAATEDAPLEEEDPGEALRRRLEGLRGLSA